MSVLTAVLSVLLALPGSPGRAEVLPESTPGVPAVTSLRLVLGCADCAEDAEQFHPGVGLLWPPPLGSDEDGVRAGLRCLAWASGEFEASGPDGLVKLQGARLPDGAWAVDIPLGGRGLPFRLTASAPGHVALPGAAWPAAQLDLAVKVAFVPVATFLRESPAWDPSLATECDLVIPAALVPPHVLEVDGAPRAWLYQAPGGAGWTFQFVRPGGSLLERVAVPVEASQEAGDLVVRLPLDALALPQSAGGDDHPDAGRLVLRGAGPLNLADCPRLPQDRVE